jgi:transcriptional regulator with XRE-family HTH domain
MTSASDTFGQRLRYLRKRQALSQAELAERAGITRVTIIKLEADARPGAWPRTVRKLARALGVRPAQLTVGEIE